MTAGRVHHVRGPCSTYMAQGLNDRSGRAAGGNQMFGRRMAKIDHPLPEHNTARRPIRQPTALRRDLRREAERVGSLWAVNLRFDPVSRASALATLSGEGARAPNFGWIFGKS